MTAYLTIDHPDIVSCNGAGVRIAIIDSGIAVGHPHVGDVTIGHSLVGTDERDTLDRLGHGTAVAAAIREKVPAATLVPVRVLDRQLATSAAILAEAIHWAANDGAHLINLSLGTTNVAHLPLFREALHAAQRRGAIVLSANSHDGVRWYPGSLAEAAGVVAVEEAPRHGVAVQRDALGDVLAASPYPRPIAGVPVARNVWGVSFAVANACGIIARAFEAGMPREIGGMHAWIAARVVPSAQTTN